jgi:hypothetical protein
MEDEISQNPAFREWLSELLRTGEVMVNFTKKDGTVRSMRATTCPDLVPARPVNEVAQTKKKQPNPDVMPAYDLDAQGWRSFRWDSVRSVRLGHAA